MYCPPPTDIPTNIFLAKAESPVILATSVTRATSAMSLAYPSFLIPHQYLMSWITQYSEILKPFHTCGQPPDQPSLLNGLDGGSVLRILTTSWSS
jgi:hypothetical protein